MIRNVPGRVQQTTTYTVVALYQASSTCTSQVTLYPRHSVIVYFYCCTVHFDDSIIFIHQLMHSYIYIIKSLKHFVHLIAIKWTKCFSDLIIYIRVHKLVYENNWNSVIVSAGTSATRRSFHPFPGKAQIERRSNFENSLAIYLRIRALHY
jgi:hypothetical protein